MATATARNLIQTPTSSLELNDDITPDRNDDRLLDARQVAAKLGVSERFIRDHTTRRSPDCRRQAWETASLPRYRCRDLYGRIEHPTHFPSLLVFVYEGIVLHDQDRKQKPEN
jgi:hypothetical protein